MNSQYDQTKVREFWDQQAATFDNEPDHGLHDSNVRQAWTHLLEQYVPTPPARVLDMGCGTGSLSLILAELGFDVVGADISKAMIERATEKVRQAGQSISFHLMDAAQPNLAPQQFQTIIGRHILWALPNPQSALQRWTELLHPDGRLLLVEGYWHTQVGLRANQVIETLPLSVIPTAIVELDQNAALWDGPVEDERYLIVADQRHKPVNLV